MTNINFTLYFRIKEFPNIKKYLYTNRETLIFLSLKQIIATSNMLKYVAELLKADV